MCGLPKVTLSRTCRPDLVHLVPPQEPPDRDRFRKKICATVAEEAAHEVLEVQEEGKGSGKARAAFPDRLLRPSSNTRNLANRQDPVPREPLQPPSHSCIVSFCPAPKDAMAVNRVLLAVALSLALLGRTSATGKPAKLSWHSDSRTYFAFEPSCHFVYSPCVATFWRQPVVASQKTPCLRSGDLLM